MFCWHKKPLKIKVLSTILYYSGLSYRVVAWALRDQAAFSHEAVRLWFRKLKQAWPILEPKHRKIVAIDETKLKLNGQVLFVWAAVDVKTKEVLACRVSWQRSIFDAETFLRKVLQACTNKPLILVDGGPWYPEALNNLHLRWRHVTFGMRNHIERWFGYLKARTKFLQQLPKQLNYSKHQNLHRNLHRLLQHPTQTKNLTRSNA